MVCRGKYDRKLTIQRDAPRIAEWVKLMKNGYTLHRIGLKYGLTRERIRQILKRSGISIREFSGFKKVAILMNECLNCGAKFYRKKRGAAKPKFCKMKCMGEYAHNKVSDKGVPRKKYNSREYPIKKYKMRYMGQRNGKPWYRHEHRVIMEQHLGRPLKTNEHVHHIDGNGLNNKLSNLVVIEAGQHAHMTNIGWGPDESEAKSKRVTLTKDNAELLESKTSG